MLLRTSIALIFAAYGALAQTPVVTPDPWNTSALIQPADLAQIIKSPANEKPEIIFVGFPILYKGAHIADAQFVGPCSKPEGLAALTKQVSALPRDKQIVIYCGCCPFVKCPNIRPAYSVLKAAGFTRVKVLKLDTNLHTDWVEKNYPLAEHPDR